MFPVRAASFGNPDTLAAVATEAGPRGIERLLELQELDLSIDRLTARRDELESGEEVRAARAERTAERTQLLPAFEEDLLDLYDDLRRQKRGVGAAALVDGVCQGCHQALSAMELSRLKKVAGVKRCEYCRRILVGGSGGQPAVSPPVP